MAFYRRGEDVTFRAGFFEDAAQTVPRPAIDVAQPTYEIVDPDNTVVASGSGVPDVDAGAGFFKVDWSVPVDAPLGPQGAEWRIDWFFVDAGGHSHAYDFSFEIREREQDIQIEEKRHGYISLAGMEAVLLNRRTRQPHSISLAVSRASDGKVVETVQQAIPAALVEIQDGDVWAYKDSVLGASLDKDTTYNVVWTVQETPTSFPNYEYETLHVLSQTWLPYMSAFDQMVNKVRARGIEIQKPTEYEKFNALSQGLKIVNGWHPNSVTWPMEQFPHSELGHFVLMAAQFWWLNSLFQAEGLLAFNFSGQTITLDYDHTGWIESSISRALDFLNTNLGPHKFAVVRRAMPVGVVAVRPARYGNFRDHRIYKISSVGNSVVLDLLVGFGLI